jgi:hypothetical protein
MHEILVIPVMNTNYEMIIQENLRRIYENLPASVTCLFSANAMAFMPLDGLADMAEYTSKKIISLID